MQSPDFIGDSGDVVVAAPDFDIVMFCDTTAHGYDALGICQRLIERFDRDFLFHLTTCDFTAGCGRALPTALRQADSATLVLIVVTSGMPEWLWSWLEVWSRRAAAGLPAVVALGGAPSDEDVARLERFCAGCHIDVITPAAGQAVVRNEEFDQVLHA